MNKMREESVMHTAIKYVCYLDKERKAPFHTNEKSPLQGTHKISKVKQGGERARSRQPGSMCCVPLMGQKPHA